MQISDLSELTSDLDSGRIVYKLRRDALVLFDLSSLATLQIKMPCSPRSHVIRFLPNGRLELAGHKDLAKVAREDGFALIGGRLPICRQILRQFSYLYRAVDRAMNAFAFASRTTTSFLQWDYGMWHILEWLAGYETARESLYGCDIVLGEAAEMVAKFSTETLKGFEEFKEMRCPSQKRVRSVTSCSAATKNTS